MPLRGKSLREGFACHQESLEFLEVLDFSFKALDPLKNGVFYRFRTGPGNPGKPWKFLKPWKSLEIPGKALVFFLLSPGKSHRTLLKK